MRTLAVLAVVAASSLAFAGKPPQKETPLPQQKAAVTDTPVALDAQDDARKAAEAYLQSISRQGNDGAIETLLGGASMTARLFALENWKIVGREKHRHEEGELGDVQLIVAALDKEGRAALAKMMGGSSEDGGDADNMGVSEISAEEAKKILAPTRAKADHFKKTHPVFAYVARVDKEVYWHPKNPFRKLLTDAGKKGKYTLEVDKFWVETAEGVHKDKTVRKWPLRVVRFTANGVDTGLKILPASDWEPE